MAFIALLSEMYVCCNLFFLGGYDSILRVWNIASVTSQLTQELNGHKAFINSIIFDQTGNTISKCIIIKNNHLVSQWNLKYPRDCISALQYARDCISALQYSSL